MLFYEIIQGDTPRVLAESFLNESVSLVVTSPPYKEEDGYSDKLIKDTCNEIWRILKPVSLFFLNFGHLARDKTCPFKVLFMAMESGFQLNETFIWVKNHFSPIKGDKRVNNLTEFVFLLYKGKMPKLNRLSIGIPYVDESNAKRFNNGLNLRCRGNVWEIPYKTINNKSEKLHPDRFPVQLPEFCIKLSNVPKGSIILDPFMGSGTTGIAAKNLGMNFTGIEKCQCWIDIAKKRLEAIPNVQTEMFL